MTTNFLSPPASSQIVADDSGPSAREVIDSRMVLTHFQPLVSIRKKGVLGLEALSRGGPDRFSPLIPPHVLFSLPQNDQERVELDRLCREKALEEFGPVHKAHPDVLLSLNLDASLLDMVGGSKYLLNQVRENGINPNSVIIEIVESKVRETRKLLSFIDSYKKEGFLIALDDIGAGCSTLERVAAIKPDVIKLDRSLVRNVDRERYKFEVTKSLVRLGQRIGAMVIGEGVETLEESVRLLELGVEVFQGFHFSRPSIRENIAWNHRKTIQGVSEASKATIMQKVRSQNERREKLDRIIDRIADRLRGSNPFDSDQALAEHLTTHEDIECLYLIDLSGTQVSSTICNPEKISLKKRFIYQPAPQGSDHSLRRYFLPLKAGLTRYISDPYVSMASGNLCQTISTVTRGANGRRFILCIDISVDG